LCDNERLWSTFGNIPKKIKDLFLGGGDLLIFDLDAKILVVKNVVKGENVVINIGIMVES